MEARASRWPNKVPQALRWQFRQDSIGNREAGCRRSHWLGAETGGLSLGEGHVNFSCGVRIKRAMTYKRPPPTRKTLLEEATLHYLESVIRQYRNALE